MDNLNVLVFSAFIVTLQRETCYLTTNWLLWFLISACHVTYTKAALMRTQLGYVSIFCADFNKLRRRKCQE